MFLVLKVLKQINYISWRITWLIIGYRKLYIIDVPSKTIGLSDTGIDKAEKFFKLNNLYDIENVAITHFLDNALRANYIMTYDVDYLVNEDQERHDYGSIYRTYYGRSSLF